MSILVTGSAGFIGFHLTKILLEKGFHVIGIDNLNEYYDVSLKKSRLDKLKKVSETFNCSYVFHEVDIYDQETLYNIFKDNNFDTVVHLAAQAGVRYSITNPKAYIDSNIIGFYNILEAAKKFETKHLLFDSSSSVYGMSDDVPFSVDSNTESPISLYAASKKSNELMAFSYSHLFNIKITGLRFFTVYGPYGRPDMAYFKFTKSIDNGNPIDVFNSGDMKRDFTYIDDIVSAIMLMVESPPKNIKHNSSTSNAPYRIFNIGNNNPVTLNRFIQIIEENIGKSANKNFLPMQDGDVPITFADISELQSEYGFQPETSIEDGLKKFIAWYKKYY